MTIREDFIQACIEALSSPGESVEIQQSQAAMAEKLARGWIETNSIEFKLYKQGHSDGRLEVVERKRREQQTNGK
jgi:hypothetical protein